MRALQALVLFLALWIGLSALAIGAWRKLDAACQQAGIWS